VSESRRIMLIRAASLWFGCRKDDMPLVLYLLVFERKCERCHTKEFILGMNFLSNVDGP